MAEADGSDLTDSERLELRHQARLDAQLQELREAEAELQAAIRRVHEAAKDVGRAVKEAKDSVKRLSQEEVRKHLAKEAQREADRLREDIKRDRRS